MAVRSVGSILTEAVEETLRELTEGKDWVDVAYHIDTVTQFEYCEGDEEEPDPHMIERLVWRLDLCVSSHQKFLALSGTLPYLSCCNGDPVPIQQMARELWGQFEFSSLMLHEGLDRDLNRVAKEVEGGP